MINSLFALTIGSSLIVEPAGVPDGYSVTNPRMLRAALLEDFAVDTHSDQQSNLSSVVRGGSYQVCCGFALTTGILVVVLMLEKYLMEKPFE